MSPDIATLKRLLHYDPATGMFTRRITAGSRKAGEIAGTTRRDGYILISVAGRQYLAHRLAWLYVHGQWPQAHTDHIDGDRANNRIENLREATASQNGFNSGAPRNNTSGHKGVSWSPKRRKWVAQITINRVAKNLGGYDTLQDAISARIAAERDAAGEFACPNHH